MYVELVYSVQNEMVFKPTDFLIRSLVNFISISMKLNNINAVVEELAKLLNYTQSQQNEFTKEINIAIEDSWK